MALNGLENHKGKKKHNSFNRYLEGYTMSNADGRALVTCTCEAYHGIIPASG